MGSNLLWDNYNEYEHEIFFYVMAGLAVVTWLKLLIKMQMTERFGPTFKIIIAMFGDLFLFYLLWGILLCALTSIACLIFMDLEEY